MTSCGMQFLSYVIGLSHARFHFVNITFRKPNADPAVAGSWHHLTRQKAAYPDRAPFRRDACGHAHGVVTSAVRGDAPS